SESKLSQEDGAQYLYDLYKKSDIEKIDAANPEDKNVSVKGSENKDLDIKTYSDIFPYEWDKIESRLLSLSARVKNDVQEKKLPAYYEAYGSLLEKTANVYGSKVITPEILDKEWEDLYDIAKSVYDSDCPLMIIPQGCTSVAGEAGKIDAEIRLGLKTKETKQQEQGLNKFTQIAQEMLSVYDVGLDKSRPVPKVNLNYQPWAFGPNLYWQTRGESGESQILSHTNAVSEVAIAKELPLVEKVFDRKNISDEQYARASVVETVLHETGHCVIEYTDKKVAKRIGKSFEVDILEELKAESIGMKILAEAMKRGELPTEIDIKAQLLAKLGANLDYLKNKSSEKASSGEPYYICGVAIISNLLDKRLIVKNNSTYEISDPEACIKEIASLSDEILPFYTNDETKPADVKNYIKKLRNRGQEPLIKDFIKDL
ncbi:MAG: hypothetical protein NTX66_04540, partial [Candidatus Falkowbacteria bacterium]|nr:hypothetical protein [Candidatus Falkowbacteria bacterium]